MIEQAELIENLSPRSRAKREQIIQAAKLLFLKDGYKRTSMDAIRAEAQVSKPTLYNHFDNKEALFVGIIEHEVDDLSTVWESAVAERLTINSEEQLRELLLQFATAAVDHLLAPQTVNLAHALLAESRTFPELGKTFRERVPTRVINLVSSVLHAAHDQGVVTIEKDKIPLAARFLTAQLLSYLLIDGLLMGNYKPESPPEEELETIIHLYLRMVCC